MKCQVYKVMIDRAGDPLEMNVVYKDGTKDFKFCPIPESGYWQAWSAVAKYDDGTEKKIEIDHSLHKYSYHPASKIGLLLYFVLYPGTECHIVA